MTVTPTEATTKKPTQQGAGEGEAAAASEGDQGTPAPTRTAANKATPQRPAERDSTGQQSDQFVGIKRGPKGDLVGVQIPLPRPANNDGARTPPSGPGAASNDIPVVRAPSPPGLPSAEPVAGSPGPSQASIDAALERAAGPGLVRAGAKATTDAEFVRNWSEAPRAEATDALIRERLVHAEVMVPANEKQGVERLTQIRRDEIRSLFKDHPQMAKVLEDDFNKRFGRAGRGNFDQFMDFVSSQMARQDWAENRVGADRPGNVRVGMLGADAIVARAREIGVRGAQDPQHFSPATGAWLAFVIKQVRNDPGGNLAQTLAGATTASIMRYGVGQMVQQGRIPANANPQQLEQVIRDIHEDTGRRLQAAGGPAPLALPPVVVDTGRSRDRSDPPLLSYRDYRVMANEAIRNTLNNHRGGDRVTFTPPNGGTPFTPTRQQMQQYLASPQAKEYYYYPPRYSEAPSSSAPVMGAAGPTAGDLEHQRAERRAQELQAKVHGGAERQHAEHVAELDQRRRKEQAAHEEGLNRAQSAYVLGDSGGFSSDADAANRAISRNT